VFLDRDGVLIEEVSYLASMHHLALFPWSTDAIRALNRAGLPVVVVTNQSGIARGFFTEAFVDEVHREITARLGAGGARIDAYHYCPHHPDGRVRRTRGPATAASLDAGSSIAPRAIWISIRRARSWSATVGAMSSSRTTGARGAFVRDTARGGVAPGRGSHCSCRRRQPGRGGELDFEESAIGRSGIGSPIMIDRRSPIADLKITRC
jgi:D-glycero-D-manno-heptose 1,7-bisphosphate phosphatase